MMSHLRKAIFAVACMGVLVWLIGSSESFEKCVKERKEQQAYNALHEEGPFFIKFIVRLSLNAACGRVTAGNNDGAITAIATIIIAMFTIVLARVTGTQASLTKESLMVDKRALVFTNGPSNHWTLDKTNGEYLWHFRAHWQNSGDTPTKHMRMFAECEVRTSVLPIGFDFDTPTVQPGTAFIAPKSGMGGGLVPTPGRAPISQQDILDAQANKKFIYIWGWAKYFDVFPGTKEHVTRFCWLIMPVGDPRAFVPGTVPPGQGSLTFPNVYHTEGNCADDECK
jgi:hypothetical protein